MPEPFKNNFNPALIRTMATHITCHYPNFESHSFIKTAEKNIDALELKERVYHITTALIQYLPTDFTKAGKIIQSSIGNPGISGWGIMPLTHYVGKHGHNHFDLSMTLLKGMTSLFSSEFDIRFFLLKSPKETLSILKIWTTDPNHHVRRLVSEGSRPRLPWARQLPQFIKDPSPVIDLLEQLKDDETEYVRRSVANNLNDIAKDHPNRVADIAKQWLKDASPNRKRLIRHACRTLIKNGHQKTLHILGYTTPKIHTLTLDIETPNVQFGTHLTFTVSLYSNADNNQPLIIDYRIHHQKANGNTSPKVFKWKTTTLPPQTTLTFTKKHIFKKISTRVYYPGLHTIEIMINGVAMASKKFQLSITP
jgi:3-methyladenine DNA glycosylase AlkC